MLQEVLTELIPSYFERFVLAVGGVFGWAWGMAFGDVHLAMAWFLTIMFPACIAPYAWANTAARKA